MRKKFTSTLLLGAMVVSLLSGCGKNEATQSEVSKQETSSSQVVENESSSASSVVEPEEKLEYVELEWYVPIGEMPDHDIIQAALDEYFLEKLNCKVTLVKGLDNATFEETIPTKLLAGEEIDMLYLPNTFNVDSLVQAGALYEMDELLDTFGQETKALFADQIWDCIRKQGKIYMIPLLKDNCHLVGFSYNDTMASAIGVDFENTNFATFNETEEFFMDALAKRDAMFPEYKGTPLVNDQRTNFIPFFFKLERLISGSALAVTNIKGYEVEPTRGEHEVYNFYETDAFREYCLMIQRWVENNIISHPDDTTNYYNAPNILTRSGWGYTYMNPHQYSEDFVTKLKLLEGIYTDAAVFKHGTAIGANCEDPERAMMAINLINTDPYIATMLRIGVEDVHWTRNADGKIEFTERNSDVEARGWYYWYGASFGNFTIVDAPETMTGPDNIMLERIKECNDNAILATHMGIQLDLTPVSNEIAACNSVISEYNYLIKGKLTSAEEVNKAVDDFVAKLKQNGSDKIVKEIQAQIDAWVKEN